MTWPSIQNYARNIICNAMNRILYYLTHTIFPVVYMYINGNFIIIMNVIISSPQIQTTNFMNISSNIKAYNLGAHLM